MSSFKIFTKCLIGLLIISFIFLLSVSAKAQFFPYADPSILYGPAYFQPSIRIDPFHSYTSIFSPPYISPIIAPPSPVIRTANATITLWLTVGKTSALLVYNPTALIGVPAPPVSPSPLLSLIAGLLTTSELLTSNPIFFNYLANSYLLPTGLAFYVLP